MKLELSDFLPVQLTQGQMNPIFGGNSDPGVCSCSNNTTNSTGADTDTQSGDADTD